MSQERGPVVVRPGEGTIVEGPVGGPATFMVRGEQSGGSLTAVEMVIPPNQGPPLHAHANEDEAWYVLEGDLRFRLGEEIGRAPAGSFVFAPRDVPHAFQNVGERPARILVMFTPSGMERFFDRVAALPEGASGPEAFRSLGSEVGMEVLGPPMAVEGG